MAKIPFTLEEWLKDKSQKIETRNGRPAHYIGLDRAGWQVFEIFRANGTSEYRTYHDSYMYCGPEESTYDLFIVTPEEELTEWQRFISACLQKHGLLDCGAADRIAKNCSTELLDLARKELENDTPSIIHAQSFNAGLKHGKQEILKEFEAQCKVSSDIEHGLAYGLGYKAGKADALIDEITKIPGFKENESHE